MKSNIWITLATVCVVCVVGVILMKDKPIDKKLKSLNQKDEQILSQLKQNGDNNSLDREIDHWIYFETKNDTNNFINEVESIGYKLISLNNVDEEIYKFSVNISHFGNVEKENVLKFTKELYGLTKTYNGDYDGWGCLITTK